MVRTLERLVAVSFITALILVTAGLVGLKLSHGNALSVQSQSMAPTLNKGDLVTVSRVPTSELKIGDVITYMSPKDPKITITHRIVGTPRELGGGNFETKGDANQAPDPFITSAAIIGRVNYAIPGVGYVADFLRKPLGLALLIYLPALLILGAEIRRLVRYYQARQDYVVPGHKPAHEGHHFRHMHVVRALLPVLFMPLVLTVPAVAALQTSASLAGTTIQTIATQPNPGPTPPPTGPPERHVTISEVNLPCADGQLPATPNPTIVLYNPRWQAVDISGWQLKHAAGTLRTIPPSTSLAADEFYTVALDNVPEGLQHASDRVTVYDTAGQRVDGLSWGNDTSEINPALATPTIGTKFLRLNPMTDSDQPSDWHVADTYCAVERL
jgi:signal peptidase I